MSSSSITCTSKPAALPVDLEEAMQYLRLDGPELTKEGQQLLWRATEYAEQYQWSQLITATYVERFDCGFPDVICLQKCPIQSVTSVAYVDPGGTTQTLTANTDYIVDVYSKPARILPAYGEAWPVTRGFVNDVVVTYVAGYGDAPKDVPHTTRQGILMLANHWEEFHGMQVTGGVSRVSASVHALFDLNSFRTFY